MISTSSNENGLVSGASASADQALVSDQAASRLGPAGFDPSRLPLIEQEGERIANETWRHPTGLYLWTDLVGAVQIAIAEERARHAPLG